MKDYITMPIEASGIFSPNDLYTLSVLFFTAHNNNKTDITYQQISEITGQSIPYIKDHFIKRLKDSEFCDIITEQTGYEVRRKIYTMPKAEKNFRIIRKEIFTDDKLTSEEKGFLIGLYCHSVNNSFNLGLTPQKILDRLKVGKTTFFKLRKGLIDKGYLRKLEDVPENAWSEDFPDNYMLMCDWLGYTHYQEWMGKYDYIP